MVGIKVSPRKDAQRAFLVKQRELCVGKGSHRFKRSPTLSDATLHDFFMKCTEIAFYCDGDTVTLGVKR